MRNGRVLIEESCGFKHVLKNALYAQRLDTTEDDPISQEAQKLIEKASAFFGEIMKPTYGYWVDADPKLSLEWRKRTNISSTNFEDYGLMGSRGEASFLRMQEDCRRHFATFAQQRGWIRLEMRDVAKELNLQSAISTIERTALGK